MKTKSSGDEGENGLGIVTILSDDHLVVTGLVEECGALRVTRTVSDIITGALASGDADLSANFSTNYGNVALVAFSKIELIVKRNLSSVDGAEAIA